jgi:quercetin dioxygenase-like cupin family protein
VEIHRFGPGHRRASGTPGSRAVGEATVWDDPRGHVAELAFARRAMLAPHTSGSAALFIVVSGGGWVQVGDERVRIGHGEAVLWPEGVPHGAWTDGSEMRALLVELAEPAAAAIVIDGLARAIGPGVEVTPGQGSLRERPARREDHDETEGEPW